MRESVSRTGARRRGDDYQDLVALDHLLKLIETPGVFTHFKLEADDAGALDDVVGFREDGGVLARQVKYSIHPGDVNDPWGWDALLERAPPKGEAGRGGTSLIQKWSSAFFELAAKGPVDAAVQTNRAAAADLSACLKDEGVAFDRIDAAHRLLIIEQIGSEVKAKEFFASFRFLLDQPDLRGLEAGLFARFERMGGTRTGWTNLKDVLRSWVTDRALPRPGGNIELRDLTHAAEWRRLEVLPQDFEIPDDFVVPSDEFERDLLARLRSDTPQVLVLHGPPGAGKSTYVSHMFKLLREQGQTAIRHHYYLAGGRGERLEWNVVAESLLGELQREHGSELGTLETRSAGPHDLPEVIERVANLARDKGNRLVIILDGLDHIRRDQGSLNSLRMIVDLLLPLPQGCHLVMATQKLPEAELPSKLLQAAPPRTWLELPVFNRGAIHKWLRLQGPLVQLPDGEEHRERTLAELADALFLKSGGHPLYLRYVSVELRGKGRKLSTFGIHDLPECPDGKIRDYYQFVWTKLAHPEGRRILSMLASCAFPLPRSGVLRALDATESHRAQYEQGLGEIAHLLSLTPLGFTFFHTSLLVHVRATLDPEDAAELRKLALAWMQREGATTLRWREEWRLLQALGDPRPLIEGTTHEWVVASLAGGMPAREMLRILWDSVVAAAHLGDMSAFVRTAILHDYVFDLDDDRGASVAQARRALRLLDPVSAQVERELPGLHYAPSEELADLARIADANDLTSEAQVIADELFNRARYQPPRYSNENTLETRIQHWIAAAMAADDVDSIVGTIERNRGKEGLATVLARAATKAAWANADVTAMRTIVSKLDPDELATASDWAVLLAMEQGAETPPEIAKAVPAILSATALSSAPLARKGVMELPTASVVAELEEERSAFDEPRIIPFLESAWWGMLGNALASERQVSTGWITTLRTNEWLVGFLRRLDLAIERLTYPGPDPRTWDLAGFHSMLAAHTPPGGYDWRLSRFTAGAKSVAEFATIAVWAARGGKPLADAEVRALLASPHMGPAATVELALAHRRALFSNEAWPALRAAYLDRVGDPLSYYDEKAQALGKLAWVAALHGDISEARILVGRACACLLSLGSHKDLLLTEALEIIREMNAAGTPGTALAAHRIAPAILSIRTITDGDETRHLPSELSDVYAEVDTETLLRWYGTLSEADSDLKADQLEGLLRHADLTDPTTRAIAGSSAEASLRRVLQARSSSDQDAKSISEELQAALGGIPQADQDHERPERKAVDLPPQDFPPEDLAAYAEKARELRLYDVYEPWARYWANTERSSEALSALDAAEARGEYVRAEYERYAMAVRAEGRKVAYSRLCSAFVATQGWHSFHSDTAKAEGAWAIVLEHHDPIDFLKRTLVPKEGRVWNLGKYRVRRMVEFLRLAGRPAEARIMGDAYLEEVSALLSAQEIPKPDWLEGPG